MMDPAPSPATFVAMLGGQPQIVTFTLDLLFARGYRIDEVIVLHPGGGEEAERIAQSIHHLRAEFRLDRYRQQRPCRFTAALIQQPNGQPLNDIDGDQACDHLLDFIQQFFQRLKQKGHRLHVSVTGGRRLMSLCVELVAPFLFEPFDRMWHIRTPSSLQQAAKGGRIMHRPEDAEEPIDLIRVPVIPMGGYFSRLQQEASSFGTARAAIIEKEDRLRCDLVLSQATPRQREVLALYAKGYSQKEICEQLSLSEETVSSHTRALLALAKNAWNRPIEERLTYVFLQRMFQHVPF